MHAHPSPPLPKTPTICACMHASLRNLIVHDAAACCAQAHSRIIVDMFPPKASALPPIGFAKPTLTPITLLDIFALRPRIVEHHSEALGGEVKAAGASKRSGDDKLHFRQTIIDIYINIRTQIFLSVFPNLKCYIHHCVFGFIRWGGSHTFEPKHDV